MRNFSKRFPLVFIQFEEVIVSRVPWCTWLEGFHSLWIVRPRRKTAYPSDSYTLNQYSSGAPVKKKQREGGGGSDGWAL